MNVQVVDLFTPERVREIIAEALKIADETEYGAEVWPLVFDKACNLLAMRQGFAAPDAPMPLMVPPRNSRR